MQERSIPRGRAIFGLLSPFMMLLVFFVVYALVQEVPDVTWVVLSFLFVSLVVLLAFMLNRDRIKWK